MSSEYDVGYGKPPKKNQFKPGNQMAKRRRKGPREQGFSMSEIVTQAMTQRRKIKRGDQIVSMQVAEIMIERLVQMVTTGNPKDLAFVFNLMAKHAAHLVTPAPQQTLVTYHRAEGSKVELPPADLWKGPKA